MLVSASHSSQLSGSWDFSLSNQQSSIFVMNSNHLGPVGLSKIGKTLDLIFPQAKSALVQHVKHNLSFELANQLTNSIT